MVWSPLGLVVLLFTLIAYSRSQAAASSKDASAAIQPDLTMRISDAMQAAEKVLQQHEKLAAVQVPDIVPQIAEKLATTESAAQSLSELQDKRDALIGQANAKQLQELIDALEKISLAEQARRENETATAAKTVTAEQLHRMLAVNEVLQESEAVLQTWIMQMIQTEVDTAALDKSLFAAVAEPETATTTTSACVTTAQAVQHVQAALHRYALDGIGRVDHAAAATAGATIVHQLTSPTYQDTATASETLGTVWWNRYIPQDWEELLLPTGWQNWKVGTIIPDHVYHSLGLASVATTAPPEAILQTAVLPGNCWPVSMKQQNGPAVVTIRLAAPVAIDAVTIDHASSLLLSNPKQQLQTAPKTVKVFGYAPCSVGNCDDGLGFDVGSKTLLAEILYDIHGESNVQTFAIQGSSVSSRDSRIEEAHDEGACSAVKPSCGGGGSEVVAAVAVEVEENWGNEDYTCLYRFRVHGEPVM
jgi:Sad1 / UNC-like C-terminal